MISDTLIHLFKCVLFIFFTSPQKCPKTIASMTRYSSWFRKSFKPNIKIFLDEYDIFDDNNYKKLNTYIMPFGLNKVDKSGRYNETPNPVSVVR